MELWTAGLVPADAVAAVREAVQPLVEQIVDAVGAENAIYREVLGSPEGMGIRLGIEQAVITFLDAVERGQQPTRQTAEVWRRLGEAEFQAGRGLDALRSAFRTGTRAAWRGAAEIAADAGLPAPAVIALAEAIFVYSDELAADVVEGYLRMESDEAGERERRRRRLATLLLDDDEHDPETVARAAELARWRLPGTLAALAVDAESPSPIARAVGVDVLEGSDGKGAWLIVPDPDGPGRARAIELALERTGSLAALGPAVSPRHAARSLRWARLALSLVGRGALPAEHPTRIEQHLASAALLQDEEMASALAERALAPLDRLPGLEHERLLETLEAWLAHQRQAPAVAKQLHVHPQTVRYRVARLRELLGQVLDTPDGRFELEAAIRARRALGQARSVPRE